MGYYDWRGGCEVRKIFKMGNSYVVAIPPSYLERLNLKRGDEVSLRLSLTTKAIFTETDTALIIEPMKKGDKKNAPKPVT